MVFPAGTASHRRTDARLQFGVGLPGIERMEASFARGGFAPHRHDRYAIGVTLSGVQSFQYRGAQHAGLPGEGHILHPDEVHDGVAGTEAGLRYRILYIDPALIRQAIDGRDLPFVAEPVMPRATVSPTLLASLRDLNQPLTELERVDLITSLADTVQKGAGRAPRAPGQRVADAVSAVRDLIMSEPARQHSAAELETITGLSRWEVARQFRAAFGTSPTRFRSMRRQPGRTEA